MAGRWIVRSVLIAVFVALAAFVVRTAVAPGSLSQADLTEKILSFLPGDSDPEGARKVIARVFRDAEAMQVPIDEFESLKRALAEELDRGFDADLAAGLLGRVNQLVYQNALLPEDVRGLEGAVYAAAGDGAVTGRECDALMDACLRLLGTVEVADGVEAQ